MIAYFLLSLLLLIRLSHFGSFSSPHSPTPALYPVLAYNRIFAAFAHSPHSTVAFWQLFLAAFSHAAPAPRARVRSHFCGFRSLYAFNSRILATFAQSKHSTVEFWQLFLLPHSPQPLLPPVFAYDSSFATFAPSPYSTVAFWQLFLSPHSPTPALHPVHMHDRMFDTFALSPHSTVAFWQLLLNLSIRQSHFGSFSSLRILPRHPCPTFSCTIAYLPLSLTFHIRRSHIGRFCSISAFDGRILAAFALSAFFHVAPAPVLAYDRIFAAFSHSQH